MSGKKECSPTSPSLTATPSPSVLPSSVFAYSLSPYFESSDLLSLRATSKDFHSILHYDDSDKKRPARDAAQSESSSGSSYSEAIWKQALVRDFSFQDHQGVARSGTSNEASPCSHDFLQTLRVSARQLGTDTGVDPACCHEAVTHTAEYNESGLSLSVFGYTASDGVMTVRTAYESWRQWKKASLRYFGTDHQNITQTSEMAAASPRSIRRKICPSSLGSTTSTTGPQRHLHGPYFLRAAALWTKFEGWCASPQSGRAGQRIRATLLPGTRYSKSRFRYVGRGVLTVTTRNANTGEHGWYDEDLEPELKQEWGLHATQAVHAFHGGQDDVPSPTGRDMCALFSGLIGGYSAYNSVVSTRLLRASPLVDRRFVDSATGNYAYENAADGSEGAKLFRRIVPLAASSYLDKKVFVLDVRTGRLYLQCNGADYMKLIPAVRLDCVGDDEDEYYHNRSNHRDDVLRWLEEHASRLCNGTIAAGSIINNEPITEGIVLFPTFAPALERQRTSQYSPSSIVTEAACGMSSTTEESQAKILSRAVSHGVEVIASSVFAGEFLDRGIAFIYSIRIRLLTRDDPGYVLPSERGFETCQLKTRHWKIYDAGTRKTDCIEGDGVVGLYPLLREGGYRNDSGFNATNLRGAGEECTGTFRYQSFSSGGGRGQKIASGGSFGGHLTFVPGSLEHPTGEPFVVNVARFLLDPKPPFLF